MPWVRINHPADSANNGGAGDILPGLQQDRQEQLMMTFDELDQRIVATIMAATEHGGPEQAV